ncbi:hypothetical protein ACGF3G_21140 [Streptomyces sp. NPDC048179]|uniref:hypothetical protein n=1 Tax=Streptomyces sp. NPDC048179 TaxID=3365506 RepID=UPI003720B0D6
MLLIWQVAVDWPLRVKVGQDGQFPVVELVLAVPRLGEHADDVRTGVVPAPGDELGEVGRQVLLGHTGHVPVARAEHQRPVDLLLHPGPLGALDARQIQDRVLRQGVGQVPDQVGRRALGLHLVQQPVREDGDPAPHAVHVALGEGLGIRLLCGGSITLIDSRETIGSAVMRGWSCSMIPARLNRWSVVACCTDSNLVTSQASDSPYGSRIVPRDSRAVKPARTGPKARDSPVRLLHRSAAHENGTTPVAWTAAPRSFASRRASPIAQ